MNALHSATSDPRPHDYVERPRPAVADNAPIEQLLVAEGASAVRWNDTVYNHAPHAVSSSLFCWVDDHLAVACVLSNGELRVATASGAQFQVPLHGARLEVRLPRAVGGGVLVTARSRVLYITHPLEYPVPVLSPGEQVLWSSGHADGFVPSVLTFREGTCTLYALELANDDDDDVRQGGDVNLSGVSEEPAASPLLGFHAQWSVNAPVLPRAAFAAHNENGEAIVCLVWQSTLFGASMRDGRSSAFALPSTADARPLCGSVQAGVVDLIRLDVSGALELRRGAQLLCALQGGDAVPRALGCAAASRVDVVFGDGAWVRAQVRVGPAESPAVRAFVDACARVDALLGLALAVDVDVWARALDAELAHGAGGEMAAAARAASRASLGGAAACARELDVEWCALVLLLAHHTGGGVGLGDAPDAWAELLASAYHLERAGLVPERSPAAAAAAAAVLVETSLLLERPPPRAAAPAMTARLPDVVAGLQLEYEACKLDVLRPAATLPALAELLCAVGAVCLAPTAAARLRDYCVRDLGPARFPLRRLLRLGPNGSGAAVANFVPVDVLRVLTSADVAAFQAQAQTWMGLAPPALAELVAAVGELRARGPHALALSLARAEHLRVEALPSGVLLHLSDALAACRESPPRDWPARALALIGRTDLVPAAAPAATCAATGLQQVQAMARMRFGRDRRVREVCRLLDASQPSRLHVERKPAMTDHDVFEAQQARLRQLVDKAVASCVGRGALCLRVLAGDGDDWLESAVRVPPLSLAGWAGKRVEVRLQQEPVTTWPAFHNGVAAGLERGAASERREALTRTWIMFNKPAQPSEQHAGVLLALGLQGHLRSLTMADMYEHLAPCHDPTTVALLVGLGASRAGTADATVSKTLCLHLPALLPRAFAELDVAPAVQSAALCGLGLVYRGTGQRLMVEFLLDELGAPPSSDRAVDDREAHALAAGLALGMVGLGLGARQGGLAGVTDLDVEGRLHALMAGGERRVKRGDATVAAASAAAAASAVGSCARLYEGSAINTDVTGPGATLALGLLFLKSGNKAVAARMAVPDTAFHLDFVRPDHLTLRVWAWCLVMWGAVQPTRAWMRLHVPDCVEDDADAVSCVLAGACLGVGTRFAGTLGLEPRDALLGELCALESAASRPWSKTAESCLGAMALALACVMAGSGDLDCLKALRRLRLECGTYGAQSAVTHALGLLFLGGGSMSLRTDDDAVASLVCALAPPYPEHANDNSTHLQAMRHLYVLAAERRLVETVDTDTGLPCYTPLRLRLREGAVRAAPQLCHPDMDCAGADVVAPCLLPPLRDVLDVEVASDRFWPSAWGSDAVRSRLLFRVKRRAYQLPLDSDPLGLSGLLKRPQPVSLERLRALLADFFPALGAFSLVFKEHAGLVYRHLVGDRVDALGLEVELADGTSPLDAWQRWFLAQVAPGRLAGGDAEHAGVARYLRDGTVQDDDTAVALALLGVPRGIGNGAPAAAAAEWAGDALVAWGLQQPAR